MQTKLSSSDQAFTRPWWKMGPKEVAYALDTDLHQGLRESQAKERLLKEGFNQLPETAPLSSWQLFIGQFSSFIIWVLIGAVIISLFLQEWLDALSIGLIIILNAIIGFFQEYKAEQSLAALKKLSMPFSKVIRQGELRTILAREIVRGDVILVEAGDRVPADGRFIQATQLSTREAELTGEAVSIQKTTHSLDGELLSIGDRKNMGFMGTTVVNGKGLFITTETGLHTEIGKIASLLQKGKEEQTPLQLRLEKFGQNLVWICLGVIGLVFGIGILRDLPALDMLLTSLSLAVAAIPEGLPAIVTITLASGVRKMAKRHALIRRLPSIETLGCTTVICTDKTGTLTQNEMVVRVIWVNDALIDVTGLGYIPEGKFFQKSQPIDPSHIPELSLALKTASLCNNASLYQEQGRWEISGDPTEAALLVAAKKMGLNKAALEKDYPQLDELPFDSERKCMSFLRQGAEGNILFTKGAPDVILNRSASILLNGQEQALNLANRKRILEINHQLASQGLRVLALAYRNIKEDHIDPSLEERLVFIGLIAMMDPPRQEAKAAIQACKEAGIRPVMITGDHRDTAIAIAKELGIIGSLLMAIEGKELDEMTDLQFIDKVKKIAVYARVSAAHKLRIVKAWKQLGEVIAMTGDGVNDAPAIKKADIGIAMGVTGTDVTKEASDMIITDDNFTSIVNAIEEGRGIYDNILKSVNYLLSSNIAEILVIFFGMLLNFRDSQGNPFIPLLPIQLLWMNLVTDGFPAIALALDPIAKGILKQPPRHPNQPILSARFAFQIILISLIIAAGALIACKTGLNQSPELAHTMAFTTLIVLELVRVQMVRFQYNMSFFSNRWLLMALMSSLFLQLLVIYLPPLQIIFKTVPLQWADWGLIGAIAVAIWIISYASHFLFAKGASNR
ncbi:cation-translocating P-type ATPase [Candidatus Protochlamydia phocaeensis]|uniref:cation-translocating P-type ATPase n=1 Tax=Candidatus Protochlamydia phocaeensis TaxID=1414722 RepID=UPI0008381E90|nr:cation-translocating P-type ATPase [Candidatus Protochlamydia phocaeensis]